MNPAAAQTATSGTKEPCGDVLFEMEEMLRELNAEIAALGQARSMSLEVLRDLIEETVPPAAESCDRHHDG